MRTSYSDSSQRRTTTRPKGSNTELLGVVGAPLNMVDLSEDKVRFQVTKDDVKTKNFPVHVLLVVPQQHLVPVPRTVSPVAEPTGIWMKIEEFRDVEEDRKELTYYQRRGRLIKDKCIGFCAKFLDKVDESYHENERPSRSSALKGRQVWGNRS